MRAFRVVDVVVKQCWRMIFAQWDADGTRQPTRPLRDDEGSVGIAEKSDSLARGLVLVVGGGEQLVA